MSAATQIYYDRFDAAFLQLSTSLRKRIELHIDQIGSRLDAYPHRRLKNSNDFRARVGDYRIIYNFDLQKNAIHLLAIGHRREIYRTK